ncbi:MULTISPECIES: DUF3108 domain-containing protein [unclassified Lentimicrobium]|uniref:DUF3108 domain-containing protein n=1 Tax=unclassified Lentimicrobium TaxID=2677434 RepID=UPI0015580351|nr:MULTISPECIES: DUF3108 domain-containing protein [unclassified Lentimicrobium]NPD44916.1 DUF3108 domain-containing protein [Lentimicrobium sp. S6]NPD85889.1 DUF3108 domain-containing protein [Lentimicrobium sp. L6]
MTMLLAFMLSGFLVFSQGKESLAFERGESLKYWVYYDAPLIGKVYAGKATLEIAKDKDFFNGRTTFHAIGSGRSTGSFDFFFKVRDKFESWFDEESLKPYRFVRRTNEGGYKVEDDVDFDYLNMTARSRQQEISIGLNTQDMVSAFYFARNLDIDSIQVDDNFPIDFYLDDSVYTSAIIYKGIEIVETSMGKFRCHKFLPMVITGEVFDNPYPMSLWITDDKNRIPILVKSEIIVGSIKGELFEYKNLKYPLGSKLSKKKRNK